MNENCSLTVVIVNQVQRAYSISVSLAKMYIKLSLCIERIIIINSILYKKANASGDVKPVQLWTIKQVSALCWNELREAPHIKENKQIKILPLAFKRLITSPGKTVKKNQLNFCSFLALTHK